MKKHFTTEYSVRVNGDYETKVKVFFVLPCICPISSRDRTAPSDLQERYACSSHTSSLAPLFLHGTLHREKYNTINYNLPSTKPSGITFFWPKICGVEPYFYFVYSLMLTQSECTVVEIKHWLDQVTFF